MEHLDSKYFERVIAALKEAKAKQNIEINEQFRQSLRVGLTERAGLMSSPTVPGWADLVLRYKYLFGGVPVLAALVLVAVTALNHQVPVVNDQLITETPTKEGQNDLVNGVMMAGDTDSIEMVGVYDVSESFGPVTFSADLVMPPAEVLAARERFLKGESEAAPLDDSGLQLMSGTDSAGYIFLENDSTSLNVPMVATPSAANDEGSVIESGKGSVVPDPIVVKSEPVVVTPVVIYSQPAVVDPLVREEFNGQVTAPKTISTTPVAPSEASGKVIPEQTYQAPLVDSTITKTSTTTVAPIGSQPLPTATPLAPALTVPTASPEVKSSSVPVLLPSGQTMEVQSNSSEYLNTVELQTESAPKITMDYGLTDMMEMQVLEAKRIYYVGDNREQLVTVVLEGLKPRVGSLSRDYYVNIVKFVDGTYRATLYEYGKASQLLVIAEQRSGFKIVTEVVY